MVNGGVYALSAPVWGYLCDKRLPSIIVTLLGSVCIAVAFVFIGPVPFIPVPTSLGLCIGMLFIHGLGFAAQLVAAFSSAHSEALIAGKAFGIVTSWECVMIVDLRVQVHPGELWVSKQRVHLVLEASKSAGAKGDVPKNCGFMHPLHPC